MEGLTSDLLEVHLRILLVVCLRFPSGLPGSINPVRDLHGPRCQKETCRAQACWWLTCPFPDDETSNVETDVFFACEEKPWSETNVETEVFSACEEEQWSETNVETEVFIACEEKPWSEASP
jgi:hypothetical protein